MAEAINRYANQDLFIARTVHEAIGDFVRGGRTDAKPFGRQVDVWWLAMSIGLKMHERRPLPEDRVKFNDGAILSTDPWRITHLELIALAEEGDAALDSPATVIRIASEYANAGFDWLIDKMVGQSLPALALMNGLREFTGSTESAP